MSIFTHAVCVIVGAYNPKVSRAQYKVDKVLQVFKSKEEADEALEILNPERYNGRAKVKVVPVEDLDNFLIIF